MTVTGANRGEQALVSASMVTLRKGPVGATATAPLGCITSSTGQHATSTAFFAQANDGVYNGDGHPATARISTICQSWSNQRLVTACLVKYYGAEKNGILLSGPMHTLPAKDRMALVSVVQLPNHPLTDEQLERARRCAAFLREYLPNNSPSTPTL
jgi:DNA (cytosine-5)-methyltransferase 1